MRTLFSSALTSLCDHSCQGKMVDLVASGDTVPNNFSNAFNHLTRHVGAILRSISRAVGLSPKVVDQAGPKIVDGAFAAIALPVVPVQGAAVTILIPTKTASSLPLATLSSLPRKRRRQSMLPARLHCVAKLNVVKGNTPFARGRRVKSKSVKIEPVTAKRSPSLVAIKRQQIVARKAVTRVIVAQPIRRTAEVIILQTKSSLPSAPRLKRAA
jgi:hypothetical protein